MGDRGEIEPCDLDLLKRTEKLDDYPEFMSFLCEECGGEFFVPIDKHGPKPGLCPTCRKEVFKRRNTKRMQKVRVIPVPEVTYRAVGYEKARWVTETEYLDYVGNVIPEFMTSLHAGVIPFGLIVEDNQGNRRIVYGNRLHPYGDKK